MAGAALAVAYLTAYSAYGFFHFVAEVQALGLLFMVACIATVIAVTRRALSIAVLAMIGAYIAPAFALHASGPVPVYGYYVAASSVTLVMVWQRGWRPLIHLSFLFTLAGALFFGWTQKFYAPQYYAQMQPVLLALVALHLAMPLLETPSSPVDAWGIWSRRFDRAYFLLLPLVAAILSLILAPHVQRDGALAFAGLGGLWLIAGGAQHLRFGAGGVRYLAVAATFLVIAGLLAVTDVPIFLIASVAMCLAVAASGQLRLSSNTEFLVSGVAVVSGACYVLQALFESASGPALLNGAFLRHVLLGAAMVAAGWSLNRRERAMAPIFLMFGTTWLITALVRELARLEFVYLTQISYLAVIVAIAIYGGVAELRSRPPNRMAVALFGVALLVSGALSSSEFSPTFLIPLMLAGQILYSLLALQCDRDPDNESAGAGARSALPVLILPWAIAFNAHLAKPHVDVVYTLLVSSALFASLQAQWLLRRARVWPNWLSPVGFVIFGALLLYESLFHIERQGWAVAFELIGLIYVMETARFLSLSESPDARLYEYAAIVAVASVSAAMLLRLMGPPGTLNILDLNRMLLPAVVSLLWAAIGALLSWLSARNRSRTMWSLGAFLLAAAALKLILLDFGSLGQIGNILAMLAAGGVFLLVAWLAPFPPAAATASDAAGTSPASDPPSGTRGPTDLEASTRRESDPTARRVKGSARHSAGQRSERWGWIWVLCPLVLIIAYAKWFTATHVRNVALPTPPGALQQRQQPAIVDRITVPIAPLELAPEGEGTAPAIAAAAPGDVCRNFADRLSADYLVYGTGDPGRAGTAAYAVDVELYATPRKVVLLFGSEGPTVWQIRGPGARNVLAVVVSGRYRSEVRGLPDDVSILHAAYDDHAPCGYFQINADQPQGANVFVSKLLIHTIDASFLPAGDHVVMGNALPVRDVALPAPYIHHCASREAGSQLAHLYGCPLCGRTLTSDLNRLLTCFAGEQEEAANYFIDLGKRAVGNEH
jgi:hypothetical protein